MYSLGRRGHASVAQALRISFLPTSAPPRLLSLPPSLLKRSLLRPIQPFSSCFPRSNPAAAAAAATVAPEDGPVGANEPITRFEDLAKRQLVCRTVVDTLMHGMLLETMTAVQSQTIHEALKGDDILARARTGTGKTLAFLIPVLQRIIGQDPTLERPAPRAFPIKPSETGRYRRPSTNTRNSDIRAIIISPTRELAEQIAVEARRITQGTGVVVQTAVGGTGKQAGLWRIRNQGCHILVGTPGRLNDILSDPTSGVAVPNLDALVLDEADRLLDQGFAAEIESIRQLLPSASTRDRQTLMFSATVPKEVMQMVGTFMKRGYRFVQTVQPGEQQTHERVVQKAVYVNGLENMLPSLLELIRREEGRQDSGSPFKAIVFFNANTEAQLSRAIFQNLRSHDARKVPIIEMHAKLTQINRTRASDMFRRAKSAVMFSSDVSARGMDFPNVTHVIQMNLPRDQETYIHRLGRTARGDKRGEGWIFMTPMEQRVARQRLKGLPLVEDSSLEVPRIDMTKDSQLPASVAQCLTETIDAARQTDLKLKAAAYTATLGTFQWASKGPLVEMMNRRAIHGWGMTEPPSISAPLAQKLNLRGLPGLRIAASNTTSRDSADLGSSSYRGGGSRMSDRGRTQFKPREQRRFEPREQRRFEPREQRREPFQQRGDTGMMARSQGFRSRSRDASYNY